MQNNPLNYLGWGIIGCPNGYQHSSDGVDKQLNIAYNYLDLKNEIGEALPDADKKDTSPLFCLAQFEKDGNKILTLTEYHSIKQKGTNRSGTFLGAFIEMVNCHLGKSAIPSLIQALNKLCKYQYRQFVDVTENRYIEEISAKPFATPEEDISHIASELTPWNTAFPKGENVLYLSCQDLSQFPNILQLIFEDYLLNDYSKIYFSASDSITQGFKKLQIETISLSFSEENLKLRGLLGKKLSQVSQQSHQIQNELNRIKVERETYIKQAMENEKKGYENQIEQHTQLINRLNSELTVKNDLAYLGDIVLKNAQKYVNGFDPNNPSHASSDDYIKQDLSSIKSHLEEIKTSLHNTQSQTVMPVEKVSKLFPVLSIIFAGLSVILLASTIYLSFGDNISKEDKEKVEQYNDISAMLDRESSQNQATNQSIPLKSKVQKLINDYKEQKGKNEKLNQLLNEKNSGEATDAKFSNSNKPSSQSNSNSKPKTKTNGR